MLATINALSFHKTSFDIIERNGSPWLKSSQIAEALGYADEAAITRVFARNQDEFTAAMTETVKLTVSGNPLSIPVRIFSLRGCHMLAMFARTPVAKDFRRWVLDILDKETAPVPTGDAVFPDISNDKISEAAFARLHKHLRQIAETVFPGKEQLFLSAAEQCILNECGLVFNRGSVARLQDSRLAEYVHARNFIQHLRIKAIQMCDEQRDIEARYLRWMFEPACKALPKPRSLKLPADSERYFPAVDL